jgi:hypothetical protein
MSAYAKSTLDSNHLTDADVVDGKGKDWAVASTPVEVLTNLEQTTIWNPLANEEVAHPCDVAHSLVIGDKKSKGRRESISKASPIVHRNSE